MFFALARVQGHSMEPTLKQGDIIFISRLVFLFRRPRRGDIIAFTHKNKLFIKRIQGIVNNTYRVRGDNKQDSLDSKVFGAVRYSEITGKVLFH